MRQPFPGPLVTGVGGRGVKDETSNVAIALRLREQDQKIQAKYESLGGAAALGHPTSKDAGRVWTFSNGSCICFDRHTSAAYQVHGAIYQKWLALGGLNFGVPCTDELPTPDGVGRYNHFSGNTASIYWTPEIGAQAVKGAIRERWAALGWENSYLGYPTTDEFDFQGGQAVSFQHGDIYSWPDTGPVDLGDVVVQFRGFYCLEEAEADGIFKAEGSDSPFAVFGVTAKPNEHHSVTTRVYEDVNDNHAQSEQLELYRGRAYGLAIGVVLMEHDHGDVEKDRQKMMEAFKKAHDEGVAALASIKGAGDILALAVDALLGEVVPALGGVVYDSLGLSDDRIGGCTMTVTARDMVLMAAQGRDSTFHGINYRFESPVITGMGAQYKLYFTVVPA